MRKISSLSRIVWLLSFVLTSQLAGAAPSAELFSAEVVVPEESVSARNKGIREAFQQVLMRLTGSRSVQKRQGIANLMGQAASYVQQYRYRLQQDEGSEALPTRFIRVSFDRQAVIRALRELDQPVWLNHRPEVLVWLVADRGGRRAMVDVETEPGIRQALMNQAAVRGLGLRFPLLDLEDQSRLTASDLWSGFEDGIRAASVRYTHTAILVGRLSQRNAIDWISDWSLLDKGNLEQFPTISANLLDLQLMDAVDLAMDYLARRHAPIAGNDAPVKLSVRVTEVQSVADYAHVMRLFKEQPAMHRLAVRAAHSRGLDLDIWYRGGRDALENDLPVALVSEFASLQYSVPLDTGSVGSGLGVPDLPETDLLIRYQH